jgi:hypothetical protein
MGQTVKGETVRSGTIRNDQPVIDGKLAEARRNVPASAVALSAGWGTTASATVTGDEREGTISVTSAGTGQAAGATVTVTLPGGAKKAAPLAYVRQVSGTGLEPRISSETTTTFVITVDNAPVAANTYVFQYSVRDD